MKTAYSYVRFSRPEQIRGDSLRRQTEGSEAYCQRKGYHLDTSLNLTDLGVSAFKGRNVEQGALGAFLDAVKSKRVKPGSVLIVESLDRLSRNQIGDALELFLGLLRKGVEIVTLTPEQTFTKDSINDVANILTAIIYMARAHEESATKSVRVKAAWNKKREQAADIKLTGQCPAWLRLAADKRSFDKIPSAVKTVRRIFRMAIDGLGTTAISKRLNQENVPTIGRAKTWHKSYIAKILHSRAVIGEYQPCIGHAHNRTPVGNPIQNYFPAIVSEADYYNALNSLDSRRNRRGPNGKNVANLFKGLLFDARDGATMTLVNKGNGRVLVSSAAQRGETGSVYLSFPYAAFEDALLRFLTELKASDLCGPSEDARSIQDDLQAAEGKLAELEKRIGQVKTRLLAEDGFDALADVLKTLTDRREEQLNLIEQLRQQSHNQADSNLSDVQDVIGMLGRSKGKDLYALRTRLAARIRQLISEVWVLVQEVKQEGRPRYRMAYVQVWLRGGGVRCMAVYSVARLPREYPQLGIAARGHGFGDTTVVFDLPAENDLRKYRDRRAGSELRKHPEMALFGA
jgi:DNA invertase Pin-like site-specific DNA recombinase